MAKLVREARRAGHSSSPNAIKACEPLRLDQIRLPNRSLRKHPARQISQLMASISEFGPINPLIVDASLTLIAGEARYEAARQLGLETFPAICVGHLTPAQIKAYRIADNKLAERGSWDEAALRDAVAELLLLDVNIEAIGFEPAELDLVLSTPDLAMSAEEKPLIPAANPIPMRGDNFSMGDQNLMCGDSRNPADVAGLMAGCIARMAFNDFPYNQLARQISTRRHRQRPFAMASGEQSRGEFREFLRVTSANTAAHLEPGGLMFGCTDWRQIDLLLEAGHEAGLELLNLVVWAKQSAGMGSFYRSQHELIPVFRKPGAQHTNHIMLGSNGRHRTNLWSYPGGAGFYRGRSEDLDRHPTPKPVNMVADALLDCTKRGDYVLDLFGGGGTTAIAAQLTGRRARLMEIDPGYVQASIERFEARFGIPARHVETGLTLKELAAARGETSSPGASAKEGEDE